MEFQMLIRETEGEQIQPVIIPLIDNMTQVSDHVENAKKKHDYEALCHIINQWNNNRLDLFALSLPNEHLEFHGVMRFYYQSADMGSGQKVATKCIRVSSTAVTREIIETLIEKFRPDMKMLEVPEYALYEIHESGERKLNPEEKPLLVQLNWHKDDREGRFLLRRIDEPQKSNPNPFQIKEIINTDPKSNTRNTKSSSQTK
jgi:afadin